MMRAYTIGGGQIGEGQMKRNETTCCPNLDGPKEGIHITFFLFFLPSNDTPMQKVVPGTLPASASVIDHHSGSTFHTRKTLKTMQGQRSILREGVSRPGILH